MSQSLEGLEAFCEAWNESPSANVECGIFPSVLHIERLRRRLHSWVKVGAQDCSTEKKGAFTGEVSAQQIRDMRADWVLIGHSERRTRVPETESTLAAKWACAESADLNILFCVGESLEQRQKSHVFEVLESQLKIFKPGKRRCIAYEPIWAIGTGMVAKMEQIHEVHQWIHSKFPRSAVLYGGSVNSQNCAEILKLSSVGGLLVGGASLESASFSEIYRSALANSAT